MTYFPEICRVTEVCSRSENVKIGAMAFEFWTTLNETEFKLLQ